MLMGFKPSPYCTTRDMKRIEPKLRGNRTVPTNVFRWKLVILNLPGSINYTPSKPWVYRVREDGTTIAADLFVYIDDLSLLLPLKGNVGMQVIKLGADSLGMEYKTQLVREGKHLKPRVLGQEPSFTL